MKNAMTRFEMLVRVLDGIRSEASVAKHTKLYAVGEDNTELVWQARARAYIHLYLKVMFGVREFLEREHFVTDGAYDGGIDGYYVDPSRKEITLIQSKFRSSQEGFETKRIQVVELLAMQIKRILSGEEKDECGEPYNGKINGLQRRLSEIPDLGRYTFKTVILANVDSKFSDTALERLTDGFNAEIFDFARTYKELLLPVLAGNLFKAKDISITLDLSNKGAGSKINYHAETQGFDCDVTVVFVPIIEIAKLLSDYKNSVLKFNPRSYLEIAGNGVNTAVRKTVIDSSGNDFALLNNGITLICDESTVSEQSGRKHKAQLFLMNPQIINGGQTAYTLSLLYDETPEDQRNDVFSEQEVLVKAIALTSSEDRNDSEIDRLELIERISTATNSQTAVSYADRLSHEDHRLNAQSTVYDRFGILVEMKRGEFAEGVRAKYIDPEDIVERTLFHRLCLVANGELVKSLRKRVIREDFPKDLFRGTSRENRFYIAFSLWNIFSAKKRKRNQLAYHELLPKVYAGLITLDDKIEDLDCSAHGAAEIVNKHWDNFLEKSKNDKEGYVDVITDVSKGTERVILNKSRKNRSKDLSLRLEIYFAGVKQPHPQPRN